MPRIAYENSSPCLWPPDRTVTASHPYDRLRTALDDISNQLSPKFDVDISYYALLFLDSVVWLAAAWSVGKLFQVALVSRGIYQGRGTELPKLLTDVVMIALIATAVLIILAVVFDQPLSGLIATSGFLAAVVGFSLRNMISDLFSGIALRVDRPFEIGDWLEIDSGEQGEVIEMNWRATRLVTIQGRMVVISNSQLADGKFINLYRPKRVFRVVKTLVVDYQAPPQRVIDIFMTAILSVDGVVTDHLPIIVLIERSTDQGLEYGLHFWVDDAVKRFMIERQVVVNALDYLNQAGLAPAYPKLDAALTRPERRQIEKEVDTETLLARVDLLGALPSDALASIARKVKPHTSKPSTELVRQGEPGDSLYIIVSGFAAVLVVTDKKVEAKHVASLQPGAVFGEASLLTGATRSATVTASTTLITIEIAKSDLRPVFQSSPDLVDQLADLQAKRSTENQMTLLLTPDEQEVVSEKGMKNFLSASIRKFFMLQDTA